MKDEPQPPAPAEKPEDETPASGGGAFAIAYLSVMAVVATLLGSLFFQEPVVSVLQGGSIDRVDEMATKAGRAAEAECTRPGTAAATYEAIQDLAQPRLVMSFSAYTPSGLADVLERLEAKKIAVRAPYEESGGISAIFRKGAADGGPDVLELGGMSKVDDLTAVFMERVIEEGPGMKPGAMMILHHDFKDGGRSTIIAVPAGAQEYQAIWPGNPFPTGEVNRIPAVQCRLD